MCNCMTLLITSIHLIAIGHILVVTSAVNIRGRGGSSSVKGDLEKPKQLIIIVTEEVRSLIGSVREEIFTNLRTLGF